MNLFKSVKRKFVFFCLLLLACGASAQDLIFWSGTSANGNWEWGNGCSINEGGNWYWSTSGSGNRKRPDCYASYNIIKFDNSTNLTMNLNSSDNFSANQILFITGTSDRIINSDASRSIHFQNNNGNCKIENSVSGTTHTFNVPIFINSGGNNMEINPVNGYLNFTSTILNNSNNAINVYGSQQVTVSGDIAGIPGVVINNNSTLVYSGVSKTYFGTTTINDSAKLKISSNQTLGNITLNGGTLQVDAGVILTITGTYSSISGSIIDNKGTIKFAGGFVTFPESATINNGTSNTLTSLEIASLATVILNTDIKLGGSLSVDAGGTFDNGGENQIINGGGSITISGTFITRDADGFVGANTAIPSIIPTLNTGSTVEYGLSGNQVVQGETAPTYSNIIFSGSGTKTLASTNNPTGIILIKNSAILDVGNHSFGTTTTKLTMTGTSELRIAGTDVKPDAGGTYSLGSGTKITFTNLAGTLQSIRLSPNYYNIDIVGTNVGTNTKITGIKLQTGGTLTIKNGATFKLSNTAGFTGATNTAISNVNPPTFILETGSTVEYAGDNQSITNAEYSNLTVSGKEIKTIPDTELVVGNDLKVNAAATLKIESGKTITVNNAIVVAATATMTLESNDSSQSASLVQINDTDTNSGNVRYDRTTTPILSTDYTYWSSPVFDQTLLSVSPNTSLNRFFLYDPSIKNWERISSPSTYKMILGKGYIFWGPTTYTSIPAVYKASFIGKPNNGKIEIPIAGTINVKTYNLVGNPYPSALDADKFLDENYLVLDGTIYFWTHNTSMQLASAFTDPTKAGSGTYAYTSDDYATYNKTGGTSAAPSGVLTGKNVTIPNGKIAAGQAFFTTSIVNGKAVFKNAMRLKGGVSGVNNSQFFRTTYSKKVTENTIEKNRIWLDLTNDKGAFKQTLVGYIEGASNDYESRYDGLSMNGNKYLDFYSINQDKNFVIQGRALPFDENDEVSLGFKTSISGDFTMNIDQADGLLTNQAVFIEDKVTNTIFDLRNGNYTFNTTSGVFNDRFVLHYTNKALGNTNFEKNKNQITVSTKNKQITVNSVGDKIDKVRVYDILGKQIYIKNNINSNVFTIANLVSNKQMLLLKITLQNGKITNRKIVY
jgi:hypothetical protein